MNNIKIRVNNVEKTIGDQVILKNINMEFIDSRIYGLVGRNGSGKTVLLKCICGFMSVSKGEIWLNDKLIGKDISFIENLGFIIDTPGFLPEISGYKNLLYLASIRRKASKQDIYKCMEMVGLDYHSKKPVGKYSLGMKQRLGIAQAIMENPDIIILDEPMNGLDIQGVEDIRKLLLKLKNEGKLIIITSHNNEDIEVLCDEVYKIEMGIIKQLG
ncbi:ATP-binding cassette domain-containing protein [Anaerocolumna aminovalerica]|uniref:ABC-2 type transport system ATP-binding protein n=1 Tax=Anaerocolumna aminovalerica TaxID=1527 RepID=A0A1I5F7F1_9FIRM|nr:ATP-binding cassette domain-containing protein [Anaerocolumna aminovalerica]MDU6266239.1 ATP-binding cassette domain-containing protein [Anaerocolumna aminovalerica]SFO19678.1 ABC-2 type transport system ATP-binding protein [Anaerocolumna aminovalerica]